MKLKPIAFVAILFLQQAVVFSQTNPLVKYLPGNASMVMTLNLIQLGHKIPGDAFHQNVIYRQMMKNPNPELNSFFADPASFGLDLSNDIFIASTSDTSQEHPGTSVHIFGLLKDESLFTHSIEKLVSGKDSINVYGTNKILFAGNGGLTLAWNNEIFVVNIVKAKNSFVQGYKSENDSNQIDFDKKMKEAMAIARKIQRNLCFELLTPHPQNSFGSNTQFTSLLNMPGDIKMWTNGKINPALNKVLPIPGLTSKLQAFTGKSKTAIINFENGKIVMQSRNYLTGPVAAVYEKYPTATLNTDLARRLPKGKLLAMINISYNPEMSKEIIEADGIGEMIDSVKKIMPFDLGSMNAVFKNSMMLAVLKTDEISPDDSITRKMEGIQILLAIPIADKAKFLELMANTPKALDLLKNSAAGGRMLKGVDPAVRFNDSLFVISSSAIAATRFLNDKGSNTIPGWLQSDTHHGMMMYVNMKELLELFGLMMSKRSPGKTGMKEQNIMNMFDQMVVYGGDYQNGSLRTTMELKFTNQTDNALKQLFDMINMAAEGKTGK